MLALVLKSTAHLRVADLDMFHEMALIREALVLGFIPRYDVFAYTPTVNPSVHHEWATGAVLYFSAVTTGLGGTGILVLWALLLAATIGVAFACARRRGATGALPLLMAPLALGMLSLGLAPVRAHMFTFLFVACLLLFLAADERGGRWWIAAWLPLYVLWVNLHGGFVVGAGFFALYACERFARLWWAGGLRGALRRTRHLLAAGIAMLFLPLLNPYGWEYIPYLWHALSLERPLVAEWAPLWDPRVQPGFVLAFAVSLLLVIYAVLRSSRPLQLPGLLLLAVAALFTLRSQRILPIYAVVWFCYVPAQLARTELAALLERFWSRHSRGVALAALAAGVALTVSAMPLRPWELRLPATAAEDDLFYPVGAVAYLAAEGFRGNLMTPFNSGAFVSWKLYPAVRVGMDSRYEVAYPPAVAEENHAFYQALPGWERVLARYPTDAVLVPRTSPLDLLLAELKGAAGGEAWERVYQDDGFSIFARPAIARTLPRVDRSGERIPGSIP